MRPVLVSYLKSRKQQSPRPFGDIPEEVRFLDLIEIAVLDTPQSD